MGGRALRESAPFIPRQPDIVSVHRRPGQMTKHVDQESMPAGRAERIESISKA
jgi:hypothetical protein